MDRVLQVREEAAREQQAWIGRVHERKPVEARVALEEVDRLERKRRLRDRDLEVGLRAGSADDGTQALAFMRCEALELRRADAGQTRSRMCEHSSLAGFQCDDVVRDVRRPACDQVYDD